MSFNIVRSYWNDGKSKIDFEEFSELPHYVKSDMIDYTLILEFENHKIQIPFQFEEGYDTVEKKIQCEDDLELILIEDIPNGIKSVRFGMDNSYKFLEIKNMDEFFIGSNLLIDREGLKFYCRYIQEIDIRFELLHNNLSGILIKIICDIFDEEASHFKLSR